MTDPSLDRPRSLRRDELGVADEHELAAALETALLLERSTAQGRPQTAPAASDVPPAFSRRVMAAIQAEPAPGTFGFMLPLRRRGLVRGFLASVRQARIAVGPGHPSFARATALGYVLAVAIAGAAVAGGTTVGVGSALGLFNGPTASEPSDPTQDPRSSESPAPARTTQPSPSPAPSTTVDPTASPDASDDHGGSPSAEPGDDHGGNSGPGSSSGIDDHSGSSDSESSGTSGSSGESSTPRPTDTPQPTKTPKPSETPH